MEVDATAQQYFRAKYHPMLLALTVASGHSGVAHPRTGPELSDFALFACAALGVWLVRRRMRRRVPKD